MVNHEIVPKNLETRSAIFPINFLPNWLQRYFNNFEALSLHYLFEINAAYHRGLLERKLVSILVFSIALILLLDGIIGQVHC